MPHKQRREQNEMLDALKVAVEAIFDLGLHVQILAGYKCFRINLRIYPASVNLEWLLTLLLNACQQLVT